MTDKRLEWLGFVALLSACLLVAVPVPFYGDKVLSVSAWLWWPVYAGFLLVLFAIFMTEHRRITPARLVVALTAAAQFLVLSASGGWTSILLVFATAVAAHVTSTRATLLVLAANSVVVGFAALVRGSSPGEAGLTLLLYTTLQLCSVWAVWANIREIEARRRLAVANVELQSATVLLAESSRANERLRIARELHDTVGHQLTALTLELETAKHRGVGPGVDHLVRARSLAGDLLGNVRTAVGELRARTPGLLDGLRTLVTDLPKPRVHLSVAEYGELDEDLVSALIRCAQEAVTNALRHSGAENLWIEIGHAGDALRFIVRDDGCGTPLLRMGNGLTGIKERIEQLGGSVSFDGTDGFRMVATVPLTATRRPPGETDPPEPGREKRSDAEEPVGEVADG